MAFSNTSGTVALAAGQIERGGVQRLKITWTSTAGGGAIASGIELSGQLLNLITIPGAGVSAYSLTLTDSDGVDVLNGAGATRSTSATEAVAINVAGVVASSWGLRGTAGDHTLTITGAGNAKSGTIIVTVWRNPGLIN